MTVQQIDLHRQGRAGTLTDAEVAAGAAIADSKLAVSYIKTDGTRALTGEQAGVTPTLTASLATKGYVDSVAQGATPKNASRVATDGSETYTVASGSVTSIAGTTIGGVTIAVNDRVLVKNAPAATGAGVADTNLVGSSQPGNGMYFASAVAANITLTRDPGMDTEQPAGASTFVEAGTYSNQVWTVTSPSSSAAFTYGTTSMQWSQSNGLGDVTVGGGGSLVKTANALSRAALTGDVTASADNNATTIAAGAVSLAKMANLAANSVIANTAGSGATPTATALTSAATASTVPIRDANANVRHNNLIENFQSVASAATTTTLVVGSPKVTQITGATTQTVVMPDATTLVVGQAFTITNRSSGVVTVNMNGGSLLQTMAAGSFLTATVTAVGTSAGTWDVAYTSTVAGGDASTNTSTSVDSEIALFSGTGGKTLKRATGTGLAKLAAGVLSTATVSTDYLAPSSRVTRETPTGTVNGSTTSFGLANTPIAGTEEVYLNGIQQEPGAGNDYTISGATITYLTAPLTGDKIRVSYFK